MWCCVQTTSPGCGRSSATTGQTGEWRSTLRPPFSRPTDNTSHTIRIYLDEIAYDRITMLRSRKMLGDSATIDHHADHGFVSASPAMNYMELYPFINRLWCKSHPT